MGMFDTASRPAASRPRRENTLRKLERMNRALRHEEPDRVPISDFFWGSFTERWRRELNLPADAEPYSYYDLDWVVTVPNMDPWIRPFETLTETTEKVVVKTGFGAVMHKYFHHPMPETCGWEIDEFEKLERAQFDAPDDPRRFWRRGTTRSPEWETGSSGIHLPGSTPCGPCGPTFPSTAVSLRSASA